MKLIDLSQPFYVGGMHWDSKMDLEVIQVRTIEANGQNYLRFCFGNHTGTHLDAPKHIIPGGKSIDQLPLDIFCGPGVVLNLLRGPSEAVTVNDLKNAKPSVRAGDIVLLNTGWTEKFNVHNLEYRECHPYLNVDAAEWLVEKKARMVGIDAISLDLPHSLRHKGFKHASLRILLENEIPAIHNLTNLGVVAGKRATIMAFPIKFSDACGSPARVVAQVD